MHINQVICNYIWIILKIFLFFLILLAENPTQSLFKLPTNFMSDQNSGRIISLKPLKHFLEISTGKSQHIYSTPCQTHLHRTHQRVTNSTALIPRRSPSLFSKADLQLKSGLRRRLKQNHYRKSVLK